MEEIEEIDEQISLNSHVLKVTGHVYMDNDWLEIDKSYIKELEKRIEALEKIINDSISGTFNTINHGN